MAEIDTIVDRQSFRSIPAPIPANPGSIAIENIANALRQVDDQGNASPLGTTLTLPPAWATVMPLGDSEGEGLGDVYPNPTVADATMNAAGITLVTGSVEAGAWRRHVLDILGAQGISIPQPWFVGARGTSADKNIPGGQISHQCTSGQTAANMATNFASYWAAHPASGIWLCAGTNDIRVVQTGGGTDAQAAAAAQTAYIALLAAIKASAPNAIVMCSTIPAGSTVKAAADLFKPLMLAAVASAAASGQKVYVGPDATAQIRDGTGLISSADNIHPNGIGYHRWAGLWVAGAKMCPFSP